MALFTPLLEKGIYPSRSMLMLPRIEKDQGSCYPRQSPRNWGLGDLEPGGADQSGINPDFRANSASIVEHAHGTLRQQTLGLREPLDEKILLQILVKHFPLVRMSIDGDNKAERYVVTKPRAGMETILWVVVSFALTIVHHSSRSSSGRSTG